MKSFGEKYNRRRYKVAYSTSVLSIAMVLFMLGLLLLLMLYAGKLSTYFREHIGISLVLDSDAKASEIMEFKNSARQFKFVKSSRYISKEEAAKKLQDELGEDFITFIGYNPLPPTLELFLYEEYTSADSLAGIKQTLLKHNIIRSIEYEHQLLDLIDHNISRISNWVLGFSVLLLIIAVFLVHNTIRLSIYSKRMLIKSMLLVGASQGFIRKPFLIKSLYQGLAGGVIAVMLLIGVLFVGSYRFPELGLVKNFFLVGAGSALIIGFGLLITWLSTYIAVKKYLNIRSEDLY